MTIFRVIIVLIILASSIICAGLWLLARQGLQPDEYAQRFGSRVRFDDHAIPTFSLGPSDDRSQLEGFVVASERLWQMDLLRRAAVGSLAEIFGPAAVESDIKRRQLGVDEILARAVEQLPIDQRRSCESYAQGVNQFIKDFSWRWGIEFILLRYRPEMWSCKDSMAVLMMMAEDLSGNYQRELKQWQWRRRLPESWQRLIYTDEHPWNQPLFGQRRAKQPEVPPQSDWLAPQNPEKVEIKRLFSNGLPLGSNGWAYRGKNGVFVANDPHLPQRVPQIWYAMRIIFQQSPDWLAGVAIPGLPGVIIGMNQDIAWGFTNTGEDVDDLIMEKLSEDGNSFRSAGANGIDDWRPLARSKSTIKVRGGNDLEIEQRSTDHGPLIQSEFIGQNEVVARKWLGLLPEYLRIPSAEIGAATDWEKFNRGVDEFSLPSQNIVYADRTGLIGYRTSGRGIIRGGMSRDPIPRGKMQWRGVADVSERKRMLRPLSQEFISEFIATANQRIWVDDGSHDWSADDRANRIAEVLSQRNDLGAFDMQQLQHDTFSRFSLLMLHWIMKGHEPQSDLEARRFDRWSNWTGRIVDDPTVFVEASFLEDQLMDLLLSALAQAYMPGVDLPKYQHFNRRAWLLTVINDSALLQAFGLSTKETTRFLIEALNKQSQNLSSQPYQWMNRWRTQHPFVDRIPVVGKMFALTEVLQSGSYHTVKVEIPKFGASGRFIWALSDPSQSVWSFPVGQSGHIRSLHFRNQQKEWVAGKYFEVFPTGHRPTLTSTGP